MTDNHNKTVSSSSCLCLFLDVFQNFTTKFESISKSISFPTVYPPPLLDIMAQIKEEEKENFQPKVEIIEDECEKETSMT